MARKRILFISHHGTLSGAPISLLTLMKYFKANRDWDFHMVMRKDGPLRAEYERVAPTEIFYRYFLDPSDMRGNSSDHPPRPLDWRRRQFKQWCHQMRMWRNVRRFSPDLVYSNTSVNGDLLSWFGFNKPTIVHVRELETTVSLYNQKQLAAFGRPDYRYFSVSKFVQNYLFDTFDIARERVSIVPGSLEPEKFDRLAEELSDEAMRTELGLPDDAVVIGAIGSVDRRKGVDVFVDVAIEVLKEQGDASPIYFVWIGAGGMLKDVKQKAQEAGFADRIIFAGARKNPYPYLRLFSIGLMTSRDDPFPRSVLEMASFGAPIVCYRDAGGAAEFVGDSAGVILDSFDAPAFARAIRQLLGDEDARRRYAAAARVAAREQFTTSVIGARAAGLIDEILEVSS